MMDKSMQKNRFRLIIDGFFRSVQFPELVRYLRKEHHLGDARLKNVLNGDIGILNEYETLNEAELHHSRLTNLGVHCMVDELVASPMVPFLLPRNVYATIKKELSKMLRTRSNLTLNLVRLEVENIDNSPVSMLGLENNLSSYFRECDTITAIDERYMLIIGFATDGFGAAILGNKICRVFEDLLGDKVNFCIGTSIFPDEGQTVDMLLKIAQENLSIASREGIENGLITEPKGQRREKERQDSTSDLLARCFSDARGRIFQRFVDMDPETLWVGLSRLSIIQQSDFLFRLPYNSPLVSSLGQKIKDQEKPISDNAADYFKAIIHQMDFEENMRERNQTYQDVTTRLNQIESLPTLSAVAFQIFHIASKADTGVQELAEVIKNDPPLTLKILKIVNSAFYGFHEKIHTINHALTILGTDEIKNLTFGLAMAKCLESAGFKGSYSPERLWHHSMGAAYIAAYLSRYHSKYQDQDMFTAGLLHDFGKIFFMENFSELYDTTLNTATKGCLPIHGAEEENFGISHQTIGRQISSNWNLPDYLVDAIAFHHQPSAAGKNQELAALIGLADYLYYKASFLEDPPSEVLVFTPYLSVDHFSLLKKIIPDIDEVFIEQLTEKICAILRENEEIFNVIAGRE
jgi:HD-like signal output (HDOD) protein